MRLSRSRKGDLTQEQLGGLVLLFLSVIILLFVVLTFRDQIFKTRDDGACASELARMHLTNVFFEGKPSVQLKNCQETYQTVKLHDLPTGSFETTDAAVKKKIAESMRNCWVLWGRGEKNLFDNAGEYCSFCTQIEFDKDVQDYYIANSPTKTAEVTNLGKYLRETKGKDGAYYEETLMSYRDIQTGDKTFTQENLPAPPQYHIAIDKPVVVLFSYSKLDGAGFRAALEQISGVNIGKVGTTAGAAGLTFGSGIVAGSLGTSALTSIVGTVGGSAAVVIASPVITAIGGAVVAVGAVAAVGTGFYVYTHQENTWNVIAATYITNNETSNPNDVIRRCQIAGQPSRSP